MTEEMNSRLHYWTAEEYLTFEERSEERHEYYDGVIYDRSGESRYHNLITVNVSTGIGNQLRERPCEVYSSAMRVKSASGNLYVYPDVVVTCGNIHIVKERGDTLLNPTVLFEITSPASMSFDHMEKFTAYKVMPSLQEYVMISQDRPNVEIYSRQASSGEWLYREVRSLTGELTLTSIDCTLSLADIYEKVVFESDSDER